MYGQNIIIQGFCDSDWAQERPDQKSSTKFVFTLVGGDKSWKSQKQSIVAQNSPEAEYIALSFAVREALWYQKFYTPLKMERETKRVFENN